MISESETEESENEFHIKTKGGYSAKKKKSFQKTGIRIEFPMIDTQNGI